MNMKHLESELTAFLATAQKQLAMTWQRQRSPRELRRFVSKKLDTLGTGQFEFEEI